MTLDDTTGSLVARHVAAGWVLVAVFTVLGLTLEALHGFKLQWYLAVDNETRRFLWTLAHAHGVLLGILNVAYGLSLHVLRPAYSGSLAAASVLLLLGAILLPGGFLLGGITIHGGDPGAFIALAPIGGICVVVAAALAAAALVRAVRQRNPV